MLDLAIANLTWSLMWITTLVFTPDGGFRKKPPPKDFEYMQEVYHWCSTLLLVSFFLGTVRRYRGTIKLRTLDAKVFLVVGFVAAAANVWMNTLSPTFGTKNWTFFIAISVQNTLMYFALVFAVLIYDNWNMTHESRPSTSQEKCKALPGSYTPTWGLAALGQAITILTLMAMTVSCAMKKSEDEATEPPWLKVAVVGNRSFLMYFGNLKLQFLLRKLWRGSCSVFVHSVAFVYLEHNRECVSSWNSYSRLSGTLPLCDVHSPLGKISKTALRDPCDDPFHIARSSETNGSSICEATARGRTLVTAAR